MPGPYDGARAARRRRIAARKRRGLRGRDGLRLLRRGSVGRAVLVFGGSMVLFYTIVYSPSVGAATFEPYLAWLASVTGGALGLVGLDVSVTGTLLTATGFSMQIVPGCDAIEPLAAYVCAVLASPASAWLKMTGIMVGSLALLIVNLARLVSLFFVRMYIPSLFDMMHEEVWQAVIVVLAAVFWFCWIQWATCRKSERVDE